MNVGELFLNLGIKGTEKTVGALGNVKKGLGEVSHMSLEAKAGLVGVAYELEHMMAQSGKAGTNLTNFSALTGLSAKQLQQWQYAARQAGVSGEEMTGSIKAVQTSMTNMLMGKGAPEGMALLSNKVGFDPKRARDTFYVLEQLQKFAKTVPNDIGNSVMKSFGLSEGTISAMRRNAFTPGVMKHAPVYGDREIGSLDKANIAWSNLGEHIEMAIGHFNAKHGMQLVDGITKITDQVVKLAEAFTKLTEKLKVFELIGKAVGGWTMLLQGANNAVGAVTGAVDDPKKRKELGKDSLQFLKEMPGVFKAMAEDVIAPSMPASAGGGAGGGQNIQVQQNLHFQHDGKDHAKTADSVKKAAQHFVRQSPVQGQAS